MNRLLALSLVIAIVCLTAGPAIAAPAHDVIYIVQSGDTLFRIALRFGVTVAAIQQANGLTSNLIFVGQRLVIPTSASSGGTTGGSTGGTGSTGTTGTNICGAAYTVQRGDTLRIIANKCGATISAIASLNGLVNRDLIFVGQALRMPASATGSTAPVNNPPPVSNPTPVPTNVSGGASKCPAIYTVQRGDTLRIIGEKCGVTAQAILANNVLPNPNLIFVGQQLSIPGGSGAGSVPPPPVSTQPPANNPPPAATLPPPPVSNTRGVVGQLTLCNPEKPSFAARIERICFRELITNTTGSPVSYGILGVQATNLSGGANQFQTSWRGDLVVPAGGQGPVGGGWEDGIYIEQAGVYRLQLAVCFSTVDGCLAGTGWELLTAGVDVKVVIWTP